MATLSPETLRKIVAMIKPHVGNEIGRRALVLGAFGLGHPLIDLIEYGGASHPFTLNLLRQVTNYGELEPGKLALIALFDELKANYVGIEQATAIDTIVATIQTTQIHTQVVTTEQPISAEDYFYLASEQYLSGHLDNALVNYSEAIRLNPGEANPYVNRGSTYYRKGNLDNAIDDFSEAIRLNSNLAEAYDGRGNAYQAKGNLEAALTDYDFAIKLYPQLVGALNNRGVCRALKGDINGALADYNEVIHLSPEQAEAYNNRGIIHFNNADFDSAIADYDKCISLNSKYANAYLNRGNARCGKADFRRAIADYQKYLDLGGGRQNGDQFVIEQQIRELQKRLASHA